MTYLRGRVGSRVKRKKTSSRNETAISEDSDFIARTTSRPDVAEQTVPIVSEPEQQAKKPTHLAKCPQCGSLVRAERLERHLRNIHDAKSTKEKKTLRKGKNKRPGRLSPARVMLEEKIKSGILVKKRLEQLTAEKAAARKIIQERGFHEGASIPGSHIRKIDK